MEAHPIPARVDLVDDPQLPSGVAVAASLDAGLLTLVGYRHHRDLCSRRTVLLEGRPQDRLVRWFATAIDLEMVSAAPGPSLEHYLEVSGLASYEAARLASRMRDHARDTERGVPHA